MGRLKEYGIGRAIGVVVTGGLALASIYGMYHDWGNTDNVIAYGSAAFVTGGLSFLIGTKVDQINFNRALRNKPDNWPGMWS